MTFRTSMLNLCDTLRTVLPRALDLRPTTVTLRKVVWAGGFPGRGPAVTTDTAITPPPEVKLVSSREINGSGGRYEMGDVKIGPITPRYATLAKTGGYTTAQLKPAASSPLTEYFWVLSGQMNGEYQLREVINDNLFSFYVVVGRRLTTP